MKANSRRYGSRLQCDMEEAASRHQVEKQKLKSIIQQQADTIRDLQAKLKVVEHSASVSKTPREDLQTHTTPSSSPRVSRISLSPPKPRSRVQFGHQSPISAMDPLSATKNVTLPDSVPSPVSIALTPRTQRARTSLVGGGKLTVYRNGTEKETRPDGTCVIRFPNGDVKCTLATEAIVAYFHAREKVRSQVRVSCLS